MVCVDEFQQRTDRAMEKRVYYIDGLRTPFGSFGGTLSKLSAPALTAPLVQALVSRHDLDPGSVDQVILGQVLSAGVGQAPARQVCLNAGLSPQVNALTINKVCGSGLKSMMLGGGSVRSGDSGLVFAGGMESMSLAPHALLGQRSGLRPGDAALVDLLFLDALIDPGSGAPMGQLVEDCLRGGLLTRQLQDEYAVRSYRLAIAAQNNGRFDQEIWPVTIAGKGGEQVVSADEEPGKVKFEKIPSLKPVFDPQGSITAANASSLNDGAAVCLLASEAEAKARGLKPKAELVAWAEVSLDPADFALAPIPAMVAVLEKAQVTLAEIDLFEINEAFSAVPLLAIENLGLGINRVNVNGGAVALGHPVGASGARICLTLVEELILRKAKYGVAAICIGGGEAVAALFRRVEDNEF